MKWKWVQFNKYLYKYWKLQVGVIILGVITVPLSLVNPYLTKLVIDKAYGNKDLKLFLILAVIGGSIFVFNGLINSFRDYRSRRINRHVHFDITKDLFRHLQFLPLSFFNDRSTGEHIYRISADVGSVSNFICNTIPEIVILFPRLLFILLVVFYLNWKLALFTTLLVPLGYVHPYFFGKWFREITRCMIEKSQGVFKGLHEVFSHIYLVKALGKEDYEIKRFEEALAKSMNFELKNAKLSSISNFLSSVLNKVLSGFIALYGGYLVIKGGMTLGSLTAIMIYLTQLIGILKSIGEFYRNVTINSVSFSRISEIMDIKPSICDAEEAVSYRIKKGKIEFKDVSFGYEKDNVILKGINFLIEPAAKIALVGLSGCGKTTILSLILRLYEEAEGIITIDGIDIRKIKLESLKSQIGIALQEPFLWNDTVANNILYGAEYAAYEDMIKSAKVAEAHDFVMNLPKQYDTAIGEMACKLSEGQKQRIAIARTVIKRPKTLILDEAMSSIDSETEDKVIDNILRDFKNSTVIVVSHRSSVVKKMDLVYFLESLHHMEVGTHQALIERNLKYRELFASQIEKKEGILNREIKGARVI